MPISTALHEGVAKKDQAGAAVAPHICFVAPHLWPVFSRDPGPKFAGGAEIQQSILARLFRRHGYRVSIVGLDFGQPQAAELDGVTAYKTFREDEGIPVLRFLHPRLTAIWRALRAADADIYYTRSASMWTGVVAEFCRRHGRRSIYAGASDNDFKRGREQIRFARDRWIFQRGVARADRIVVQNPLQRDDCLESYGRQATLVPSCYELPAESNPAGAAADLVLWVGTVRASKRPELLLELARRLRERRFVMIGGPAAAGERLGEDHYASVRAAAERLPNVEFKGFLPLAEVERWFDRARVLVNTSLFEGVPNVFLQAWARGVPVVATVDIGARVNGASIYKIFSEEQEAVGEIERLFTDELHWARASSRSREYFAANHSTAEALARYARIFQELAQ
jgi:glycosyltransferase involved in cell wall biosynthesis